MSEKKAKQTKQSESMKDAFDRITANLTEQTITYDDFEKSLIHDGIKIIVPTEDDDNPPHGIGAGGYSPRKTAPSYTNPYYLKYGKGGYNRCILIVDNSCLPNCVGYAYGRILEIGGVTSNLKLPTCNAEDWYSMAKANGFKVGKTPKVGAAIVWVSGNFWNGNDGCGHIGIVEAVYPDGTILVSQSNYGGTRFFLTEHKPPYNIFGQRFVGYIYNPYVEDTKGETTMGWVHDNKGWWYRNSDGSWPANKWQKIDGKWYRFNAEGYMCTGWLNLGTEKSPKWYWLDADGARRQGGWFEVNGKWYFFNNSGLMQTGWIHHKNGKGVWNWYYCDSTGAMVTGTKTVKAKFNSEGELVV